MKKGGFGGAGHLEKRANQHATLCTISTAHQGRRHPRIPGCVGFFTSLSCECVLLLWIIHRMCMRRFCSRPSDRGFLRRCFVYTFELFTAGLNRLAGAIAVGWRFAGVWGLFCYCWLRRIISRWLHSRRRPNASLEGKKTIGRGKGGSIIVIRGFIVIVRSVQVQGMKEV